MPHDARTAYVLQRLDEARHTWVLRIVLTGSALFLALTLLDYRCAPEHFWRFLGYRIAISTFLLLLAAALHSPWGRQRGRSSLLLFVGAVLSASTLEVMILQLGGGSSDYYPGFILLAVCVSGFVPVNPRLNLAATSAVYAIYLLPILILDRVGNARQFTAANFFLLSTLPTLLFIHWLSYRRLCAQLSLEYDLKAQQASLEQKVEERTAQLSNTLTLLRGHITAQRKAEAALAQAQKMESVGRLAGGIAHDFNNLLMIILGHARLLRSDLPPGHPSQEDLRLICDAGERGASLTRQLLTFSRQHPLEMRVLRLNTVVQDVSRMLGRVLGEHITLDLQLHATADRIRADAAQLDQVLINLAVNARDAMPGGGRLTLETLDASPERPPPGRAAGDPPMPHVVLRVSDTGHGFPPEHAAKLFEPFYTTKAVGSGTGLGLATVYGVLQQHQGHIQASCEPGHGACFTIWLPLETSAAIPTPDVTPITPALGTESVLVVDDEAQVKTFIARSLQRLGYQVTALDGPEEALRLAEEPSVRIDLVLTDVVMPVMSGAELAKRLQRLRPGVPVLFMSGYPGEELKQHDTAVEETPVLFKPFTTEELAQRVRESLRSRPALTAASPAPE